MSPTLIMLECDETQALSLETAELLKMLTTGLEPAELKKVVKLFNKLDLLTKLHDFSLTSYHMAAYIFQHPNVAGRYNGQYRLEPLLVTVDRYIQHSLRHFLPWRSQAG